MSFAFVDVSSIFDSLADSLMHPERINQERHVVQAEEIYSEVWYKCSSSPLRLRRPRAARFIKSGTCKQILFCIIVGLLMFSRAVQKIFIFPEKNLQKIRVHCCFLSDSVSNIFTNLFNFPAQNTHAPIFLKFGNKASCIFNLVMVLYFIFQWNKVLFFVCCLLWSHFFTQ